MGLETLSPELVYATKGNIAYPSIFGNAGAITGMAQNRYADSQANAPVITSLTAALSTGAAITSLSVVGLSGSIPSGAVVTTISGGNAQTWTLSAAAAPGATTLAVTSETPNFAYPAGSDVTAGVAAAVPPTSVTVVKQ